MKYDKWQQDMINDESQYILLCKGRQIGGTTTLAKKAVKWMKEKGSKILVGSITEVQAKLVILMVKDILFEEGDKNLISTTKKDKPTLDRVHLKNGGEIRSRPVGVMGDAFKGFTADVNWFNEMSKWPELAFTAIMPTLLTRGGSMWGDSTPFGKFINGTTKKSFFFKCFENLDKRWKIYYKTSEEVMKEREFTETWTEKIRDSSLKFLEDQKAQMSKSEYSQEYLGLFMDDVSQWYEDELIIRCQTLDKPNTIEKDRIYYLGVDVARMGEDESTFEIYEQIEDKLFQRESQITTKTTLPQTFKHIKGLHSLYDFSKIFIDSEGLGVGVFDWLMEDDDTKHITESIDNSRQIIDDDGHTKKLQKTLKYSNMKMLMETGRLFLLKDDKIFQSLKSVQYAYTNDSLGTRHLKIFGNYTHIAEGSSNAAWGIKSKHLNLAVYPIKV